jgi:hypothetical protein
LYTILTFIILAPLFFYGALIWAKNRANFKRSLNLTFLKITLPKKESDLDEKKETTRDFKEMIGLMEQLFSSLQSIYSKKFKKRLL